mgnify:CR=1 FL=1
MILVITSCIWPCPKPTWIDDVKTALKACDDARRAVGLLRETVDPQTYEYALEEINTLVDEIKQAEK